MNPLPYQKHEVFAHIVASGNSPELANRALDDIGDPDTGRALARQPRIAARIAYLKGFYDDG